MQKGFTGMSFHVDVAGRLVRLGLGLVVGVAMLVAASAASAAPGDLDTSFGTNGITTTSVGTHGGDGADQMVRQSDGKLVVVGTGRDASGNLVVQLARYTASGALDTGYGTNGLVTLPEDGGRALFGPSLAIQPNTGEIVVAGTWGNPASVNTPQGDFGAERVDTFGNVDSSFGSGGFVDTQLGVAGSDVATAVVAGPSNDEFYIGGSAGPSVGAPTDMAVAAYNGAGTLDTSFGSGTGKVLTPISGGSGAINALAMDGSNIVAAGSFFNTTSGQPSIAVMRYTSSGSPDSAFNSGSPSTFNVGTDSYAHAVLVQSTHKIVVGGVGGEGSGVSCAVLGRLNSDGSRDTAFGSGGDAHACFGSNSGDDSEAYGLASDGTYIYAAGNSFINSTTQSHVALARFSSDGVLDTSFGSSGMVTSDPAGSSNQSNANAIVLDGSNPVIAGQAFNTSTSTTYFALERFLGSAVAPTNSSAPYYFGSYDSQDGWALPGKTIWGDAGVWTGGPTSFVFEWQLCPSANSTLGCQTEQSDDVSASSSGHTVDHYAVPAAGEGSYLRLEVKGVNSAGYNGAFGTPLFVASPPSNTQQPTVGLNGSTPYPKKTLTATTGTWSGTQPMTYDYTWLRCSSSGYPCDSTPAQSGGSNQYVIQPADVGHKLLLQVDATNAAGSVTANAPTFTGTVQPLPPPKVDAEYEPDPSNWFKTIDFSSGKHPTFTVGDEITADGECDDTGSGISHCEFTDSVNGTTDQVIPAQDSGSGEGFSAQFPFADFHAATPGWHTLSLWATSGDQSQANHTDLVYRVVPPPPPKQQVAHNHRAVGAGPTVLDPLVCQFNPNTCHLIYSGSTPVGEVQDDSLRTTAWLYPLNGAQVIPGGSGNVIPGGSGNVIPGGSGNLFDLTYAGRVICAGSGNVIPGGSGNLAAQLISDKGLGIISDKGLGIISDNGIGLIGNNAQLFMAPGAQLDPSNQLAMQMASQAGFASGGGFTGLISVNHNTLISDKGLGAADIASVASATKHPRTVRLGSGSSVVGRRGDRGHLTVLFNKRGSALIAKVARLNAQRKRHHKRLIKLTLLITTKFKPNTGAPAVSRTRTITITPMPPPKKK